MFKSIATQNLIKIYNLIQELWASDYDLSDVFSTNACQRLAIYCLNKVKMYKYTEFDQEFMVPFKSYEHFH